MIPMEKAALTLKKTRLVFYTLLVVNFLFLFMVLALWWFNLPPYQLEKKMAYMVSSSAILLIGFSIAGGFFFYSRIRRKVAFIDPPDFKLEAFFKASVLQFACFNLGGNAAIVAFLFSRDLQNLFFFLVVLIFLFFNPPSESRLANEFKYRAPKKDIPQEGDLPLED